MIAFLVPVITAQACEDSPHLTGADVSMGQAAEVRVRAKANNTAEDVRSVLVDMGRSFRLGREDARTRHTTEMPSCSCIDTVPL